MPVLHLTNEFDGSQPIMYYFITFDEKGVERRDSDGKSLSHTVMRLLATSQPRYTDVFIISHGWKSDVQEAARQYKSWIRVMAEMIQDRKKATNKIKGFKPLIIGLHWPSLLWGDERIPTDSTGLLSDDNIPSLEEEIDDFSESIANTKESRFALRNIISSAHGAEEAGKLPDTVQQAYKILLAESELKTCDPSDCPGAEDPPFNAQTIVDEAKTAQVAPPTGLLGPQLMGTGGLGRIADILMSPLRQLSFRTMKRRARVFGESGGNQLLRSLQDLAPDARFHLMGHSFGCIVVSAMIAGSPGRDDAAQPVHSLFLVQGALSLWSFAKQVPETEGMPGYFHCIMDKRLVRGPILTSLSAADNALRFFYPLGARLYRQELLGTYSPPRFGAMGTFGIRGLPRVVNIAMEDDTHIYPFKPGRVYNLQATEVIRNGSGPSGAHSDIAHPEVAHAFWAAVLAEPVVPGRAPQKARFELLYNKMDEVGKEMEVDEEKVVYEEEEEVDEELVVEEMVVEDEEESEDEQDEGLLSLWKVDRKVDRYLSFGDESPAAGGSIRPESRDKLGYPYPTLDFEYPESGAVAQEATPAKGRKTRYGVANSRVAKPTLGTQAARTAPRTRTRSSSNRKWKGKGRSVELIPLLAPENLSEAYFSEVAMQQRFIRAKIEGEDETCPVLDISYWYRFVIDVDTGESDRGIPAPLHEVNIFATGTDEVTLTAQLDSDDFYIPQNIQEFKLHRKGSLLDKVYFEISPENLGLSKLRLTILKDCNFVQQLEYTFDVGTASPKEATVVIHGSLRPSTKSIRPRDMCIIIMPGRECYKCLLVASVSTSARLMITSGELAHAVNTMRREMLSVIERRREGKKVFQSSMSIEQEDQAFALKKMAEAGRRLFRKIFFAPESGQDSWRIGNKLHQQLQNTKASYKIKIVAQAAPIPWASLYVGDVSDDSILSWDNFIGMRHIIEQKTLNSPEPVDNLHSIIPSVPKLFIGVNIDEKIDQEMTIEHVAKQLDWWAQKQSNGGVEVIVRRNYNEIKEALRRRDTRDQILYFYCHADAGDLHPSRGPGSASLGLSDGNVTLDALEADASVQHLLGGHPLIFINACRSSQMSPKFYDGFVPYFMGRGARGVVGTECSIPALFARVWAERFFIRLLNGQPLGEVFLNQRREFLNKYRNPLGLLYTMYCDGDTQIDPAPV